MNTGTDEGATRKPIVLVIDDNATNLGLVAEHLGEDDFEILVAEDGTMGLERAKFARPDLILLDVLMPGMDGFETCRRLKSDPTTREIPVIFMTALTETEHKVKAFSAGGVDYVTKPAEREELLARVGVHLKIQELTDSLRKANQNLEMRVEDRTRELARTTAAYKALGECNQVLIRATEESELLRDTCRIIVEDCGYPLVWIGLAEDDEARTVRPVAQSGFEEGYLESIKVSWADDELGHGPTGTAIRTKKPVINSNLATNPDFAPWRAEAIRRGFASSAAFPLLTAGGEAIGALNVYSPQPDAFAPAEIELLTELAGDLAFGILSLRTRGERDRAEEDLHRSEAKYRRLVENLRREYFFYSHGTDGVFTYLSPSIIDVLGYSPDEFKTHYAEFYTDHPMNEEALRHTELAIQGVQQPSYELEIFHQDGSIRNLEVSEFPLFDSSGKVLSVEGIAHDVTERRGAEKMVRNSLADAEAARDEIAAIVTSVPNGLIVADMAGRITMVNRVAERLLGAAKEELLRRHAGEVIREENFRQHLGATLSGEAPATAVELELLNHGRGEMRTIQIGTSLVRTKEGVPTGAVLLLRDVTREREIARMKDEFISAAAHELNTPLTIVMGYLELLLTQTETGQFSAAEQRDFLSVIYAKSEVLSRIVDDLLQLSRLKTGEEFPLDKSRFDIQTAIRAIADFFRGISPHTFELNLPAEPMLIFADRAKITQVLDNIISNAVKFSPAGGTIRIACSQVDDQVQIVVGDQGIGMTAEQVENIFGRFYRADTSNTAVGGIGIGMSIAKSIVEAHGGRIWVESRLGEGTQVIFTIPGGTGRSPIASSRAMRGKREARSERPLE